MKSLICIMAHKAAQETFNRHFPIWKNLGADIIVACPDDAKVDLPDKEIIARLDVGKAEHTGVQSIIRIRTILERMNEPGYDRYAFFEYDAIAFQWPETKAPIAAPVFHDDSPNRGFIGTTFLHPPLFFNSHGLTSLSNELKDMPLSGERGVWDRYIGLAIERTGIPPLNMLENGWAYSENTIHPPTFEHLARAVRNGAFAFHGVKTPECLKVILEANKLREAAKFLRENGASVQWPN